MLVLLSWLYVGNPCSEKLTVFQDVFVRSLQLIAQATCSLQIPKLCYFGLSTDVSVSQGFGLRTSFLLGASRAEHLQENPTKLAADVCIKEARTIFA